MRLLIQRVTEASVTIDQNIYSSINKGLLVLIGIAQSDTSQNIPWLAKKLVELRIFEDSNGKMNLSVQDIRGEILIISQFTLYANCSGGRRPDFIEAAPPNQAEVLYNEFVNEVQKYSPEVATGVFGANMQVHLINDGPVTIIINSKATSQAIG